MKLKPMIGVMTLLAFSAVSSAQDADSAGMALSTAEGLHESDRSGLDDEMLKLFDDREATIRNSGDRKALEVVNVDRTKFVETGELPGWVPFEQITGRLDSRAKMIEAFELAVKEYTKAGEDEKAVEVEQRRATFETESQLLMSFEHEVRNKRGKAVTKGVVKLFSNLTAVYDGPNLVPGNSTWSHRKGVFEFHWVDPNAPKGFQIDRVRLSRDGASYSGKNVTNDFEGTVHGKRLGIDSDK